MTTTAQNQTVIANAITNLDSSLKQRILGSGAFKLGSKCINLIEKIQRLEVAEQKFGRRNIDPSTGQPMIDTLRVDLEELAGCYGAILDSDENVCVFASPEALVAARETPYVKVMTEEQINLRAQLSGQTKDTILKSAYATASTKAEAFSKKAGAILGELEAAMSFAPQRELADIDNDQWDMTESAENAISKYKTAVGLGKIWDEADMVMAKSDIDALNHAMTRSQIKAA